MSWKSNELDRIRRKIDDFAEERDWDQFHSPKNLTSALSVEASELLEIFQWATCQESEEISAKDREKVAEELADVLIYAIRLASRVGLDPIDIVDAKLRANAGKYPVDQFKGSSRKYNASPE